MGECRGKCKFYGYKHRARVDGKMVCYGNNYRQCIQCEYYFLEILKCPCCQTNTRGNARAKRWKDENRKLQKQMEKPIEAQ